jgi:hypothetical protein
MNSLDRQWQAFVSKHNLHTLHPPAQDRAHTWFSPDNSRTSRIDDFLVLPHTLGANRCDTLPHTTLPYSVFAHESDHLPIYASLDCVTLGIPTDVNNCQPTPPAAAPPAAPLPRIKIPVKPTQLEAFTHAVNAQCGPVCAHLQQYITHHLAHLSDGTADPPDVAIQKVDEQTQAIWTDVKRIALETCDTYTPLGTQNNHTRCRPFLPGREAKLHSTLLNEAKTCHKAIIHARAHPGTWHSSADIKMLNKIKAALCPTAAEKRLAVAPESWIARVKSHHLTQTRAAASISHNHADREKSAKSKRLAADMCNNVKRAINTVLGTEDAPSLQGIRNAAGDIITEPAQLLAEAASQYARTVTPTDGDSATDAAAPPWAPEAQASTGEALDAFQLRTAHTATGDLHPHMNMCDMLTDACFRRCLAASPNKRAPGPDGLPNELLKHLPESVTDMLQQLFRMQLAIGRTCPSWKHSHTRLFHKKGDNATLGNFRPIGLQNTLYKLWTSCLTDILSRYCQATGILSDCQSGFLPGRNCLQQILALQTCIEDARRHNKNLYVAYIDFTNAFGSVNHTKLAHTLSILGVPQQMIDVVGNLYDGATTSLKILPYGTTQPIPIKRGTIQGDSLSPLLFLLYLEPLLQWLHVGAARDGSYPAPAKRHTPGSPCAKLPTQMTCHSWHAPCSDCNGCAAS